MLQFLRLSASATGNTHFGRFVVNQYVEKSIGNSLIILIPTVQ